MSDPTELLSDAEWLEELTRQRLQARRDRLDAIRIGLVTSSREPLFSALRAELAAHPKFAERMRELEGQE